MFYCKIRHSQEYPLGAGWKNMKSCFLSYICCLISQGSVDEETYVVAHWMLICHHLPLIVHFCSDKQLLAIASYLLWTQKHTRPNSW